MPTYPFRCDKCHYYFELTMMMSDDRSNIRCPECGGLSNRTYVGCAPIIHLRMVPGGNSGFAKADAAYERMVQEETRKSYERYRQPTEKPISKNDKFFDGLANAGYDEHKPQLYGNIGALGNPAKDKSAVKADT